MNPSGTPVLRRTRSSRGFGLRVGSVVAVLLAWQLVGTSSDAMSTFTSYPTAILQAGYEILLVEGDFPRALLTTGWGWLLGFLAATAGGVVIGFAMALFRPLDIALRPYVHALYATPRITLIPLLILWVGIDFRLRLTIVILSSIFPVIITVREGAKTVEGQFLDVGRVFRASTFQLFRTVMLPGSIPYLFVALRLGARSSLIAVIVAEMTASVTGVGFYVLRYAQFLQTDRIFVPIMLIGFYSIFLTWAINRTYRAATPSRRGSER